MSRGATADDPVAADIHEPHNREGKHSKDDDLSPVDFEADTPAARPRGWVASVNAPRYPANNPVACT